MTLAAKSNDPTIPLSRFPGSEFQWVSRFMLSWIQVQAIDAHSILNVLLSVSSASKELDGDKCASEDRKRVTDYVRNMMKGCPLPGWDLKDLTLAETFKRIGC